MIAELLTDDVGRQALVSIVLDELAGREVVCRRLVVRDELARDRIVADAGRTAGGLRVNTFSDFDGGDLGPQNWVELGGNEELERPMVHVSLWTGGNESVIVEATEALYGRTGPAHIDISEHGPHTDTSGTWQRSTRLDVDGVSVGTQEAR